MTTFFVVRNVAFSGDTVTTCKGCGRELDAEELVRHERGRFVVVHCPDCNCLLGRYNRHSDSPQTDRLKDQ